jgi:hypothetical protein
LIVAWPSGLVPLVEIVRVNVLAPAPISMMLSLSGVTVMPESVASQVSKAFAMTVSSVEPMTLWLLSVPPMTSCSCHVSFAVEAVSVMSADLNSMSLNVSDRIFVLRRRRPCNRAGRRNFVHQAAQCRGAALEHEAVGELSI